MMSLVFAVVTTIVFPDIMPAVQTPPQSFAQIDARGNETCAVLQSNTAFNHVPVTEWVDWLAERAAPPKDDYETHQQYDSRYLETWQAIKADAPITVISYGVRIDRSNSTYDPETQQLRLNPPRSQQCARRNQHCLYIKTNQQGQSLFIAYHGIDAPYPSALQMAPATARRLREQDSREELTVFFVATPVEPYRTTSSRGIESDRVYHIGVYCSVYHWED